MSLALTILISLLSAGLLAGRVFEILQLTDTKTGFLLVDGIVMNPYILIIFMVIVVCCGIIIFGSHKNENPYYSKSSGYAAALAGIAMIAYGVMSFGTIIIAPFFMAGGLALAIMTFAQLGKKKTDYLVMILMLAFAAGVCMDVVSFDVSSFYNTIFLHKTLVYLCMTSFMLVVVKNVYMPSRYSKMVLYILGMLTFAVCSMMSLAEIICLVISEAQFTPQLVMYIAFALFGIYAFDNAVSSIPTKQSSEKAKEVEEKTEPVVEEVKEETVETVEETAQTDENTEDEAQITVELTSESEDCIQKTEETVENNEETQIEEVSVLQPEHQEDNQNEINNTEELEQIFANFAEVNADKENQPPQQELLSVEDIPVNNSEMDTSKYQMLSELFKTEEQIENSVQQTENILSETRSFKKFSQPKLEESAPEYDMLKSIFKGEDISQYDLTEEGKAVKVVEGEEKTKKKRSLFGSKKDKTETAKPENKPIKEESVPKPQSAVKNTFVADKSKSSATTQTKKVVYKKPK